MNFASIDFETANGRRDSPCALGVVIVRDGKPQGRMRWLIRPHKTMDFNRINIGIHGITPEMVLNEREFDSIWPEVLELIGGLPLVAHNAAFDMSVLRRTLELYDLQSFDTKYFCTVLLAQLTWPGLPTYRLDYLAHKLGFSLVHHDCVSDADGAANVLLRSASHFRAQSITELVSSSLINEGMIGNDYYQPCSLPFSSRYASRNNPSSIKKKSKSVVLDNALAGKCFVFTGNLIFLTRDEAEDEVQKHGGKTSGSVSKQVNYLVVGDFSANSMVREGKTTKLKKAEYLAEQGASIQIIAPEDFLKMIEV